MNDDVPRPQLSSHPQKTSLQPPNSMQNSHASQYLSHYRFSIDIECDDAIWWDSFTESEFHQLLETVLHSVLLSAKHSIIDKQNIEMSCVLTSDEAIQNLNKTYRGIDKPTNILSFESGQYSCEGSQKQFQENAEMPLHLGDLVLAFSVVAREAQNQQKTMCQHVTHLLVHGVLHLLGYDHECDEEAEEMEQLECLILKKNFNYPNPYEDLRS